MNKDIFVEGRHLISAKNAAKKFSYAPDYISQLARSGAIFGRLIGRTWYVDLEALESHKKLKNGNRKVELLEPTPIKHEVEPSPVLPVLEKKPVPSQWDLRPEVLKHALVSFVSTLIIITSSLYWVHNFSPALAERALDNLAKAGEKQEEMLASAINGATYPYRELAATGFFGDVYGGFRIVTDFIASRLFGSNVKLADNPKYLELEDLNVIRENLRSELVGLVPTSTPVVTRETSQPVIIYQSTPVQPIIAERVIETIYRDFHTQTDRNTDLIPRAIDSFREDIEESFATLNISASSTDFTNLLFTTATGTSATTTNLFSTNASFKTLNLAQLSNGSTILQASRITDTLSSGDFISYWNAAGDTQLFRVDNSGNIYAGGIANSGAITITSVTTPQLRVQYDASNEITTAISSTGTITQGIIGTTPRAIWMPSANSTSTYQFQNAVGTSALTIDTTNLGITTVNSTSTNATTTSLYATALNAGSITSGLINGQTISSSASLTGTLAVAGLQTNTLGVVVQGQGFGHSASKGALAFAGGNTQLWSWGANASTIGGFTFATRSSDGSLGATVLSIDGATNAVTFAGAVSGVTSLTMNGTLTNSGTIAQLVGTGNVTARIGSATPTADNQGSLDFITTNVSRNWQIASNASIGGGNNLAFVPSTSGGGTTFTTPVMVLDGLNSRVGIGTTNPEGLLSVNSGNANNDWIQLGTESATVSKYIGLATGANFAANAGFSGIEFGGASSANEGYLAFHTHDAGNSSGERMRIDKNGNVGIGTTTPNQKLDVNGIALFNNISSGQSPGGGLRIVAPIASTHYNWMLGAQQNVNGAFEITPSTVAGGTTFSTPTAVFTSTGNVGIGTTTPGWTLSVVGTNGVPNVHFGSGDGLNIYQRIVDNVAAIQSTFDTAAEGGSLSLQPNTGSVGVGTVSPDAIFHVAKSTGAGVGGQIVIDNSASSQLGNTAELSFLTDTGASGAGTRNARILAVNENAGNGAANMQFHTWDGGSSAERMRISSSGNVGIGTTSPSHKLTVRDVASQIAYEDSDNGKKWITGTANNADFFISEDTASDANMRLFLKSGGSVGIGTVDPGTNRLSVVGANNTAYTSTSASLLTPTGITLQLQNTQDMSGSYTGIAFASLNGSYAQTYIGNAAGASVSGNLVFGRRTDTAAYSESMRIDSSGNVGIGTTGPGGKLDVLSTSEQLRLSYSSTKYVSFVVDSNGLLTIGDGNSGSNTFNQFKMHGRVISTDKPLLELAPAIRPTSIIATAYGLKITPTVVDQISGNEATDYYGLHISSPTGGGQIGNTYGAYIQGRSFLASIGTGTGGNYLCIDTTTSEVLRGNGAACTASSERFKEDIHDLDYGLEEVLALRPVSYQYRAETNMGPGTKLGFIAEELGLVLPEVVTYDNNGVTFGLDYPVLTAVLTKAVQELNTKIENIEFNITNASTSLIVSTSTPGFFAAVIEAVENTVFNLLRANEVRTSKLCVDDVCVTRERFLEIVGENGPAQSSPTPSTSLEISPEPNATTTPETEPTIDTTVSSTSTDNAIPDPESPTTEPPAPPQEEAPPEPDTINIEPEPVPPSAEA